MNKFNFNYKIFILLKVCLIYFLFLVHSYSDNSEIQNDWVVLGANDAPVKIKVFSSLTCPHCASFHIKVIPKIKKKYIDSGKVQIIFIDFPLDQAAFNASKLLHCVDQNKKIKFLDNIYESQNKWTLGSSVKEVNDNLKKIVKILGIDASKFDKCLNNEAVANKILNGRINGQEKYSINSTPTIVINEKKLKGPIDFKNIEKKIKKII